MRKIIIFTLMAFLLVGCDIKNLDDMTINEIVDTVIKSNKALVNRVGIGYKYYLPAGVLVESVDDYNEILHTEANSYYLFIDTVSYYNKQEIKINDDGKNYFYYKFMHDDSAGYVQVRLEQNKYYIKVIYNYAKIETVVSAVALKEAIYNIVNILDSITYNQAVIEEHMKNRDILNSKETVIKDFTPKKSGSTFLEYIERYDDYEKKDEFDENDIDIILPNYID